MHTRWLDIQAVALFLSVVETKSVKATAKKFGLASSTVSQNIQALEQFLGVTLLDRQIRPLQPTMRGRYFVAQAKDWLAKAQSLPRCFTQKADTFSAVRIGWGASVGQMIAPWWMGELAQKVKNLTVQTATLDRLYAGLRQDRFDLIIAPEKEGMRVHGTVYDLFDEYYWIVTSKGVAPITNIQDIQALAKEQTFIATRAFAVQPQLMDRFLQIYGLQDTALMRVDTSRVALGAVAQNAGWTIVTPTDMCRAPEFWQDLTIHPIMSPWLMRRQRIVIKDMSLEPLAIWMKMRCQEIVEQKLAASWRESFAKETQDQDFCLWV